VLALLRRLGVELGLPFNQAGSEARPCRAGQLYRVDLGGRPFALKLYDEGYHNELLFHEAVAGTGIPVARIHAFGDGPSEVDRPFILRDWLAGDHQFSDVTAVARQVGALLRRIHEIPVDGAGGRTATGWQFRDWAELAAVEATQDRIKVAAFDDGAANQALYREIIDGFERYGRKGPGPLKLLHGDLGPDNVLCVQDRVVALIDSGWFVGGPPLFDVAYVLNSRLGGAAQALLEGYGDPALASSPDLILLRLYHLVGKLIYFAETGQRETFEARREILLALAATWR
jgi:aminoglycoside phosphotransferase (APT) family kinase protein